MISPTTQRLIPVEILTNSRYIFGQIKVIQSGLVGMLTDTTNSVLDINEASIAPVHKPSNVMNYTPQLYLVRDEISAVSVSKREYMGIQGVMKSGFQRMFPYQVQISTRQYDITGTLEWPGRFEFSALIAEGTSSFIYVYDAILTAPLFPELRLESPVILINRNFLQTLIINKKAPTIPME
jgi:hypothetical protein